MKSLINHLRIRIRRVLFPKSQFSHGYLYAAEALLRRDESQVSLQKFVDEALDMKTYNDFDRGMEAAMRDVSKLDYDLYRLSQRPMKFQKISHQAYRTIAKMIEVQDDV